MLMMSFYTAYELISARSSYAPVPDTNPVQYLQKHCTAKLLSQILSANRAVLALLTLSLPPSGRFPLRLQRDTTLAQVAEMGANDPEIAWDAFNLFWHEITASESRPPVMVTIDSLSYLMKETEYRSADFSPIHALDFVLINHFLSLLSGSKPLGPSGGMVLAATSGTNNPHVESLNFAIQQLLARQEQGDIPDLDPWKNLDPRVLELLTGHPQGVQHTDQGTSSSFFGVEVQQLEGLTKDESRELIEYFAKSGLVREVVDEKYVGNLWTLTGGGVVREIERALLRFTVSSPDAIVIKKKKERRRM